MCWRWTGGASGMGVAGGMQTRADGVGHVEMDTVAVAVANGEVRAAVDGGSMGCIVQAIISTGEVVCSEWCARGTGYFLLVGTCAKSRAGFAVTDCFLLPTSPFLPAFCPFVHILFPTAPFSFPLLPFVVRVHLSHISTCWRVPGVCAWHWGLLEVGGHGVRARGTPSAVADAGGAAITAGCEGAGAGVMLKFSKRRELRMRVQQKAIKPNKATSLVEYIRDERLSQNPREQENTRKNQADKQSRRVASSHSSHKVERGPHW
ncbi:uncharacterized protein EDB93DRAFT_1103938 [Suillus bovinus]|uniref:uncharacterized protein n=1 Tax=Suillus bovinus TaxID=48563 RepID=UPI001B87C85F|nr:uncharacterized protein EDB93DRAFT_1103938 [Suillus bovinus]KAG2147856.1 hypothetical protein EDB93DRAFT_1103938 [Suillus bovinus]